VSVSKGAWRCGPSPASALISMAQNLFCSSLSFGHCSRETFARCTSEYRKCAIYAAWRQLVPSDSTTSPCVGPPASHTPSPIDNPGLFLPLRYARTGQSHRSNLYLMRRSRSRTARARRWRRRRRSESHSMPRSNKANDLACRSRRARFREYKF
jgi:hypothetical protein